MREIGFHKVVVNAKLPAEIEFRALMALESKVRDYRNAKTYSSGGIAVGYADALRALETALHNLKVFH